MCWFTSFYAKKDGKLGVKLKISGQFKTGHNAFDKIRSVIDTCKKNDISVLHALKLVAQMPIVLGE